MCSVECVPSPVLRCLVLAKGVCQHHFVVAVDLQQAWSSLSGYSVTGGATVAFFQSISASVPTLAFQFPCMIRTSFFVHLINDILELIVECLHLIVIVVVV